MTNILPQCPKKHKLNIDDCDNYDIGFIAGWERGQDETMKVLRPILENIKHRIWVDELPDSLAWDTIYMQLEQILKEAE